MPDDFESTLKCIKKEYERLIKIKHPSLKESEEFNLYRCLMYDLLNLKNFLERK